MVMQTAATSTGIEGWEDIVLPTSIAQRTSNPIRNIVDRLKRTNEEKSFLSLALGTDARP